MFEDAIEQIKDVIKNIALDKDITDDLAKIAGNFRKSLVHEGFTREEAVAIVIATAARK